MKLAVPFIFLTIALNAYSQDSAKQSKSVVEIFNSQKVINANTTELVPPGKMEFRIVHNFGDIAGKFGGIKNFFGLDFATDVQYAFEFGVSKHLDITASRTKGTDAGRQQKLFGLALKWKLMDQWENDPSHPFAMTFFTNIVVASNAASTVNNLDNSFRDFGDRLSETFQLIIAKKFNNVSVQLNPTIVTRGMAISYDQKSFFALGGALRFPLSPHCNFILDYFHPFRKQSVKDSFAVQSTPVHFYDPLGAGFEIIAGRHVFHLNFTNATEILENRFIPRTTTSWGKGQFRWGFTISRQFNISKNTRRLQTK
jgi:hypothetical protein